MLTFLCTPHPFSSHSADTSSISSNLSLYTSPPAPSEDTKPFPRGGFCCRLATAASEERRLVGRVHESSLPVTLFSPSPWLLPNNVFYPFGGLQPAGLLCSLTMEREEVKLHSSQLIFPNMPLCRRLSFLLLLSSLLSVHLPFPSHSRLLLGPLGDVVLPRSSCIFLPRRPSEESGNTRRAPAGSWTSKKRLFEVWRNLGSRTSGPV